jgi:hypothetical protein
MPDYAGDLKMIFSSAAEGVASPKAQVRSTAKCSEAWFSGLLEEWSPDLIPFWTLAVANVYQKWKQGETAGHQIKVQTLA